MEKRDLFSGLLILLIAYLLIDYIKYEERPILEVENGFIRGIVSYTEDYLGQYKSFYGIPFAKPPINELRFEPPEPPENWTGTRDAGYYRSQCIQTDILLSGWRFGSEDCLTLNVFIPLPVTPRRVPMPVLVFFHGGYWHMGSSQDHGEHRFMNDDVILVTVNYRLGALGFLSTADGVVRGNQGLKDQNMALQWIKRNIKYFGGDPNRVTIFGESVGGVSVAMHVISKLSKGLFQRAISQSGTAINFFGINHDVKSQAKRFAEKFSCPTHNSRDMVQCLKSLDAGTLVDAHKESLDLFNRDFQSMFAACIEVIDDDKAFLTEEPLKILERGDFPKIPWITGIVAHEGAFGSSSVLVNKTKQDIILKDWKTGLPAYLWYKRNDKVSEKIKNYYFGPSMTKEQFEENVTQVVSDRSFNHPISKAAKLYSKHAETYLYYFNHKTYLSLHNYFTEAESYIFHPISNILYNSVWRWIKEFVLRIDVISKYTSHGDELPLFFTVPWAPYILHMLPERDAKMSKQLVSLWTSFAKSWDTLILDKVEWEPVNSTNRPLRYLEISHQPKMIDEPFSEAVDFWESIENSLLNENDITS